MMSEEQQQEMGFIGLDKGGGVVKGQYLSKCLEDLQGRYEAEAIAIACGYFSAVDGKKNAMMSEFNRAVEEADETPEVDSYEYEDDFRTYSIFDERLIVEDESHGGCVYVPKRIVETNKDSEYYSDMQDVDADFWIDHGFSPSDPSHDNLPYLSVEAQKMRTEFVDKVLDKDSDDFFKNELSAYGFNEPMMYVYVSAQIFVDNEELDSSDNWLSDEELCKFYGVRLRDCHEKSSFSDG